MISVLELCLLPQPRKGSARADFFRAELSRAAHAAALEAARALDALIAGSRSTEPICVAKDPAGKPFLKQPRSAKNRLGMSRSRRAPGRIVSARISVSHLKNSVAAMATRSGD